MTELLLVLKRFSPQATGKSLRTRDIALRLGLPKQQCMQGKTGEDGSHSYIYQIVRANIREIMQCCE